jgi:hypothetical protein
MRSHVRVNRLRNLTPVKRFGAAPGDCPKHQADIALTYSVDGAASA